MNTFKQISWIDPFDIAPPPKKHGSDSKKKEGDKKIKSKGSTKKLNIKSKHKDMLKEYGEVMRIIEEKCTMESLFLPSRQIMVKIMRACINVESPEKLWIYDLTKQEYNKIDDVEELA